MKSVYRTILLILLLAIAFPSKADDDAGRTFRAFTAASGIADNSAQTLKCTFTGRMTISTMGNINFYDGAAFTQINHEEEFIYRLEDYDGHYHLYYDNNHHLWLKSNHGVSVVNLSTERYITNVDSVFVTYGAKSRVNDMFVDVNGDVWLCMSRSATKGGAGQSQNYLYSSKYGKKIALWRGHNLQDLEVFDKKLLMLFYEDGSLFCYDINGKFLYRNRAYNEADGQTYSNSCVQLLYNRCCYLIRNGEKGAILMCYDIDKRQWHEVMREDYHLNNMVVHRGKLYIASERGYYTYDLETHAIVHYKEVTMKNGHKLWTDINAIEFDQQDGMWLGTEQRGVLYGRPLNAPFHTMTWDDPQALKYGEMMAELKGIKEFRGKKANVMFIDSRNWTWVGTPTGLYLYKLPKMKPIVFSQRNGLMNNVIHSVIEDDSHNIWASTSNGIVCVHIVGGNVKNVFCFSQDDNLPDETFVNAKAMKLPDGQIVMQGVDHVLSFNPADFDSLMNMKPYEMHPKLTRLMVNGIDVQAGDRIDGDLILEKAVTRTKEINLNYDKNSVSLTFSALNYEHPLRTVYRVRVREISNDWIEYSYFNGAGLVDKRGLLHLPLLGLKPGSYHIELMASVVPGQFVGKPYSWVVNINEPWWRTTVILFFLGLLVLALIVVNFLVYNKNTKLKMRRNNEEGDVIRRIKAFVDRCDNYNNERLSPTQEELYGTNTDSQTALSPEFINVMQKVLPFVHERNGRPLTMQMLSVATGMDLLELYDLLLENIHKSPRVLIRSMRIDKAATLLRTTDKQVEQIADECGFVSPNYMMAKFFHKYKMTPREYRSSQKV